MLKINDVYRRIRNKPMYIKDNGTISSAVYLDSHGVSVDIDNDRKIEDIIADEERLHNFYNRDKIQGDSDSEYKLVAIADVKEEICQEKNILIEHVPIKDENPYHALLKRSKEKNELTSSQRKHLAKESRIVKTYDENKIKQS